MRLLLLKVRACHSFFNLLMHFRSADAEGLPHVLHHARRMSHNWDQTKTIGIPQKAPPTESQQERGNSIMRRLSLSGSAHRVSRLV